MKIYRSYRSSLCMVAMQVTWESSGEGKHPTKECIYSGSGKTPLLCAGGAFLGLAAVMVVEHTYMLVAVSKSTPPVLLTWDPDSSSAKALTWQAGFFFVSTWYDKFPTPPCPDSTLLNNNQFSQSFVEFRVSIGIACFLILLSHMGSLLKL